MKLYLKVVLGSALTTVAVYCNIGFCIEPRYFLSRVFQRLFWSNKPGELAAFTSISSPKCS